MDLLACSSLKRPVSRINWARSLKRSLKRTLINLVKKFWVSNHFSSKIPILIFPNPKLVPNNVYRSYTWKQTQWCIKLKIKTSFYQNSIIHQTFKIFNNNNNSHHQFTNRKTHWVNSSTTCFKTTSTTNSHESTHNSTTTTSFFINFTQKHNIPTYITFGM